MLSCAGTAVGRALVWPRVLVKLSGLPMRASSTRWSGYTLKVLTIHGSSLTFPVKRPLVNI